MNLNSNGTTAYVAGALTGLKGKEATETKQFYIDIAEVCRKYGITAYLPHVQTDVTPRVGLLEKRHGFYHRKVANEINAVDKRAIRKSDLVVMYGTEPSGGTGIEQEYARVCEVPLIMMYKADPKASRMVVGNQNKYLAVLFFKTFKEGLRKLDRALKRIKPALAN